jgi:hypothetical protein
MVEKRRDLTTKIGLGRKPAVPSLEKRRTKKA